MSDLASFVDDVKQVPGWENIPVFGSFEGEECPLYSTDLQIKMSNEGDDEPDWDAWSFEDGVPGDTHFTSAGTDLKVMFDLDT